MHYPVLQTDYLPDYLTNKSSLDRSQYLFEYSKGEDYTDSVTFIGKIQKSAPSVAKSPSPSDRMEPIAISARMQQAFPIWINTTILPISICEMHSIEMTVAAQSAEKKHEGVLIDTRADGSRFEIEFRVKPSTPQKFGSYYFNGTLDNDTTARQLRIMNY